MKEDKMRIIDLLVFLKMIESKGEARRVIEQGGVKINDKVESDWQKEIEIKDNTIVQVGKRRFCKIVKR